MNTKPKNVFIDMDGTIVEFRYQDCVYANLETILKKDLTFFNRRQIIPNIEAINDYINFHKIDWNNVYVLSLAPEINFDNSKKVKINLANKIFPKIPKENILIDLFNFATCDTDKVKIVENVLKRPLSKCDVLFDDEIKNLIRWEKLGGYAYHVSSLSFFKDDFKISKKSKNI